MGILHNVLDALGLVEPVEETPQKPSETSAASGAKNDNRVVSLNATQNQPRYNANGKSNVVAMAQPSREKPIAEKSADEAVNAKVSVKEPTGFDDAQNIADDLLAGKAVIINIENCDPEIAAKIVDFVGGVIYAIRGDIQIITDETIVSAPANINIAKDITGKGGEIDVNGEVFTWLNKYNQRSDF